MRAPSPSLCVAWLIRFVVRLPLSLALLASRRAVAVANWIEDDRVLDRPTPWLIGSMLAALFVWLIADVRG